jgi:hypothetical protein
VQRIASYPKITVTVGGRGVCAATFKHGFGYHPLLAWLDNTREALAGDAAARNANANTAADHITATDEALAQIPDEHRCGTPILICADGAGATKARCAHRRPDHPPRQLDHHQDRRRLALGSPTHRRVHPAHQHPTTPADLESP